MLVGTRAVARGARGGARGARHSRCFARIAGGEVRKGHTLELKGKLVRVVAVERVKPGKGGAYAQLELRDMRSGALGWTRWTSWVPPPLPRPAPRQTSVR